MNILYVRIILVGAIIAVAAYMLMPKPPAVSPCKSGYEPSPQGGGTFTCATPKAAFECAGSIVVSMGFSVCGRYIGNANSIPGLAPGRLDELSASKEVVQIRGMSSDWYRPCPDPPGYDGAAVCDQVYRSVEVTELLTKAQ